MKLRTLLAGCLLMMIAAACSEYEPEALPCNQDPWVCPATQSCWVLDNGVDCVNASSQTEGSDCQPFVGTTECAAGLLCVKQVANAPGQCRAFCSKTDPEHACPQDRACRTTVIRAPNGTDYTFDACMPI